MSDDFRDLNIMFDCHAIAALEFSVRERLAVDR